MAHRSARLTVFGRQLLVMRVDIQHKPVAVVATELGISWSTAYEWLRRYRDEGTGGLAESSSRPHRSPRSLPRAEVERILAARVDNRYGPHRLAYLTGHPRSTIGDVLHRAGMSRLDHGDRLTGAPVRYVACRPCALLHQDHEKLARVPEGGGGSMAVPGIVAREAATTTSRSSSTTPVGSASWCRSLTNGRPARWTRSSRR